VPTQDGKFNVADILDLLQIERAKCQKPQPGTVGDQSPNQRCLGQRLHLIGSGCVVFAFLSDFCTPFVLRLPAISWRFKESRDVHQKSSFANYQIFNAGTLSAVQLTSVIFMQMWKLQVRKC
jgi:hypothetical protein